MYTQNTMQVDPNEFYKEWSSKNSEGIAFDIASGERKADVINRLVPRQLLDTLHHLLDFGCGYGAVIHRLKLLRPEFVHSALGVEFSEFALDVARERFNSDAIRYEKLPALNIDENIQFLDMQLKSKVDAILLIDLLEHIPNCRALISALAPHTRLFLIKLPIESSVMDNYLLPKEYPSSVHSNGHLREFDVNTVHYFIRSLGLTPVFETLYRYESEDSFPPLDSGTPLKARLIRFAIKAVKKILSWMMPTKIFLRLVGGGGYICVASYDVQQVLNP